MRLKALPRGVNLEVVLEGLPQREVSALPWGIPCGLVGGIEEFKEDTADE